LIWPLLARFLLAQHPPPIQVSPRGCRTTTL
jgi:hypothetical protein